MIYSFIKKSLKEFRLSQHIEQDYCSATADTSYAVDKGRIVSDGIHSTAILTNFRVQYPELNRLEKLDFID
jgi:hypothetical protein